MSLHYELEALDDLISESLHPKLALVNKPEEMRIREWNDFVVSEKERVRKRMRKCINGFSEDNLRHAYIELQQSGLTRLLDTVLDYLLPKNVEGIHVTGRETGVDKVYKTAYQALHELLNCLQENYPTYFAYAAKLPNAYKWKAEPGIERNLKLIKKWLVQVKTNAAFTELICEPFEYFLLPENDFSFRDLSYLQALQTSLLEILKQKDKDPENIISEKLFYLNFNSVLFYNYYILKLKEEASERKNVADLVEFYSWQIKVLNQRIVKPNCVYLPHLESIRDQLVFWIAEDLHYLNKKHQLTLPLPMTRDVAKDKVKKVHVTLTVPDLALGARLLLDDVIINTNYTELMERVARNFRTNRRESLSNNNTYNEGFNISVVTKEKMKSLLLKLSRKVSEF
ncbi:MAG TPA: hypothetical protein PKA80_14320 [Ignavibacteriaceae bacterium]|nr:hypothetical protein [Ignavibacteriaceae bacterium]